MIHTQDTGKLDDAIVRWRKVLIDPSREVAAIYVEAAYAGKPPIVAVAEKLGVSQSTATRRIAQARKAGFLPKAAVPVRNRKIVDVANVLGVSYEELRSALINHAGGDIRVHDDGKDPVKE